jgi:hypothetical protein
MPMHHWLEVSGISFLLLNSKLKTENSELAFPPLLYRQRVVSDLIFPLFHRKTTTITYLEATFLPTPSP